MSEDALVKPDDYSKYQGLTKNQVELLQYTREEGEARMRERGYSEEQIANGLKQYDRLKQKVH